MSPFFLILICLLSSLSVYRELLLEMEAKNITKSLAGSNVLCYRVVDLEVAR